MRQWLLFEGRIGRLGFLLRWIAAFVAIVVPAVAHPSSAYDDAPWEGPVVLAALGLFLWLFLGLQIRRLHDLSMHGLWVLLPWVAATLGTWFEAQHRLAPGTAPKSRLILLGGWLFLLLAPGTSGPNRHGTPRA